MLQVKNWTPVDIAAELFKALRANVNKRTGVEMTKATVAIPIGFSPQKRQKLRAAAKMAVLQSKSL